MSDFDKLDSKLEGTLGREVITLERCILCRMDTHNEDVETATKTCIAMFKDTTMKHAFEIGDSGLQTEALNRWKQKHGTDTPLMQKKIEKRKNRLTVGTIYGKTRDQILAMLNE